MDLMLDVVDTDERTVRRGGDAAIGFRNDVLQTREIGVVLHERPFVLAEDELTHDIVDNGLKPFFFLLPSRHFSDSPRGGETFDGVGDIGLFSFQLVFVYLPPGESHGGVRRQFRMRLPSRFDIFRECHGAPLVEAFREILVAIGLPCLDSVSVDEARQREIDASYQVFTIVETRRLAVGEKRFAIVIGAWNGFANA